MPNLRRTLGSAVQLIFSVALAQMAGFLGSMATRPNIDSWYSALEKPGFTPPEWIFPVVWPLLYLMMGVAAWLIFRARDQSNPGFWKGGTSYESMFLRNKPSRGFALTVYATQLFLNALWSFLFFHWKLIGLAALEILVLLGLVLLSARLFYRIRPAAGLLMVPYVLWLIYAAALNGAIWWLNM